MAKDEAQPQSAEALLEKAASALTAIRDMEAYEIMDPLTTSERLEIVCDNMKEIARATLAEIEIERRN